MKKETHRPCRSLGGSKKTCPKDRQVSTELRKAGKNPAKLGLAPQALCIYGPREEQDHRPAFQELWQKLTAIGLLIQSAQRTLLSLKIEKSNPLTLPG